MSLVKLAKLSGLTPNYIGRLERGKVNPALSTMIFIAAGLGVEIRELIGDIAWLSASAARMGRLLDQAPPQIRRGVLILLRGSVNEPSKRPRKSPRKSPPPNDNKE